MDGFGGGNSTRHNCSDLPTILAGGGALGLQHGQHLHLKNRPLADLWLAALQTIGIETEQFADGRRPIDELRKA